MDGVEVFAIQVEIVKGRHCGQRYCRSAIHNCQYSRQTLKNTETEEAVVAVAAAVLGLGT
jgi:hypothetical protein